MYVQVGIPPIRRKNAHTMCTAAHPCKKSRRGKGVLEGPGICATDRKTSDRISKKVHLSNYRIINTTKRYLNSFFLYRAEASNERLRLVSTDYTTRILFLFFLHCVEGATGVTITAPRLTDAKVDVALSSTEDELRGSDRPSTRGQQTV